MKSMDFQVEWYSTSAIFQIQIRKLGIFAQNLIYIGFSSARWRLRPMIFDSFMIKAFYNMLQNDNDSNQYLLFQVKL